MSRLTNEELAEIYAYCENATEGPWKIGKQSPNGLNNVGTTRGLLTAQTTDEKNAEFIAHAREDVPLLLAEINRLKHKLATLESRALEPVKDGVDMVHINHLYELYLLAKD
ncbi:hypothetical protein P8825_15385 [Shouchella clausii]|uniref:hypothetical protein n=1 Tax=Shouchella clausii TaxID=79880 RepID=UPI002DBD3090|nr:hypothetical protein [Shouchella clausii]MEB5480948.1 hypothetical protein [Shouchella clausii]